MKDLFWSSPALPYEVGIIRILQIRNWGPGRFYDLPRKGTDLRSDLHLPSFFLCSPYHLPQSLALPHSLDESLLLRSSVLRLEELKAHDPVVTPIPLTTHFSVSREALLVWNESPLFDQEAQALGLTTLGDLERLRAGKAEDLYLAPGAKILELGWPAGSLLAFLGQVDLRNWDQSGHS